MEESLIQVASVQRGYDIQISPEERRAYDTVVRPNAIIPVPRYFLKHWGPLLGAFRAWLALAFRQVDFVWLYQFPLPSELLNSPTEDGDLCSAKRQDSLARPHPESL